MVRKLPQSLVGSTPREGTVAFLAGGVAGVSSGPESRRLWTEAGDIEMALPWVVAGWRWPLSTWSVGRWW